MCYQFIKQTHTHTHKPEKMMITALGWHWLLLLLALPPPSSSSDSLVSHRLALANAWRRNSASIHAPRSKEILVAIYQTLKFDPFRNNFERFPPQMVLQMPEPKCGQTSERARGGRFLPVKLQCTLWLCE